MFVKEVSVERLRFTCGGCGHQWDGDYDVQHAEDGHGHDRDYYFYEGVPAPDPTAAGSVLCPRCGRGVLWVELIARRSTPTVPGRSAGDLGAVPDAQTITARKNAPMLPGAPAQGSP